VVATGQWCSQGERRGKPFPKLYQDKGNGDAVAFPKNMAIFEFENNGYRHLGFLNTQNFNRR